MYTWCLQYKTVVKGTRMKLKNPDQQLNRSRAITFGIFIFAELFLIYFLWHHIDFFLNSDDASELILAKLLSEEKRIMSRNWYYSTEIRFLNTNLVYAPLFWITDNWHIVRMAAIVILHGIYIASTYFLCKCCKCISYFPVIALALVLPVSEDYFEFMLRGVYYIPHAVISFIGIGLMLLYWNGDGRKKNAALCSSCVLAVLACMGGARQMIILYLPLFMSGVVIMIRKRDRTFLTGVAANFIAGGIGYTINTHYLAKMYKFQVWDGISYRLFDWNRLITVINGFFVTFGFREGNINLKNTIANVIATALAGMILLALRYAWRNRTHISSEYYIIAVFYVMSAVIFILLYTISDMQYADRYNQPILIFSYILIAFWIKESKLRCSKKWKLYVGYGAGMLLAAMMVYLALFYQLKEKEYQNEKKEIANILVQEGYEYGYATFWNANILTELSNGKIEMHCFGDAGKLEEEKYAAISNIENINQTFQWLQKIEHDTEIPEGKVFIILSNNELSCCNWKNSLEQRAPIYHSDDYVVYGFDTYHDMMQCIVSE